MSDFWLLFCFSIISIIIAYGLGYQVGFHRGYKHRCYEEIFEHAETVAQDKAIMEAGKNPSI